MFARLYERLLRFKGDVIPFQIGDTHLAPPDSARLGALGFTKSHEPELYAYASPSGDIDLIDAIVDKVRRRNGMAFAGAANIQITCGATHALSSAFRAVMDPGEEVLLLTPYWPLIRGISRSVVVHPVEVPFSQAVLHRDSVDVAALIEKFITPKTAAIYLCNPNNPDGLVLTRDHLTAIGDVAQHHGLWVISDEVYEFFTYDNREHVSVASLPNMADRTMTVFSFSKSFALAGLRVGYVVGPKSAVNAIRKISHHTVYSVPRAMQRSALAAMTHGACFLEAARSRYQKARDVAVHKVCVDTPSPQGSTYLFLDLSPWVFDDDESCLRVLERLADAGLLLAPGHAFGAQYANWARLCFTAVEADVLEEGLERLNSVLATMDRRD